MFGLLAFALLRTLKLSIRNWNLYFSVIENSLLNVLSILKNCGPKWIIEGTGVKPDIEVIDDPALLAKGTDPQLERGITEILDQLAKNPPKRPAKPGYTDRTR